MHGNAPPRELAPRAPNTPAAVIVAFRSDYRLSVERLAALLYLEPDALREYEALGAAPPWVAYALLGLAYEQFGVEPGDVVRGAAPPPSRPLPAYASTCLAGGERAA